MIWPRDTKNTGREIVLAKEVNDPEVYIEYIYFDK